MSSTRSEGEHPIPDSILGFIAQHHILTLCTSVDEDIWWSHAFYVFLPERFPVANLMDLHLWQLDVTYLKFTDNRLGFGKKLIWTRDADFFEKWNAIRGSET